MAEVTAFRNNALPYPVYGVPYTIVFPLLDADGDPVTGATCDSEVSINGDTGADCTNEGTEITFTTAGNKGQYYLTLTAAEMTGDIIVVNIASATSKATVVVLYPRKLVELASGTAQGGAAGYITLAAGTVLFDNQFSGCLCVATVDSNVEARILGACTASNQQCAVSPGWNVSGGPDSDDTYKIYLPEGMRIPEANVRAVSDDTTAANNLESACDNYSATRGLAGTALPAAAADAAGGLPISNAGGLDMDAKLANTNEVTAARMGALTDWIDGGRLDLILDAILADTGTDGVVVAAGSKTGYALSATGLDLIAKLKALLDGTETGTVNDASPAVSGFKTSLQPASAAFYDGAYLQFTGGTQLKQARLLDGCTLDGGYLVVAWAATEDDLTAAPANSDPFLIIGRSV